MTIRVLTVFGTRPEAIKLFPLIHAVERDPRFESRVCFTGQHRDLVVDVISLAALTVDHDLSVMKEGQLLDMLTGRILIDVSKIIEIEQPHWVIVQGDTTTTMGAALAAFYRKIPVCHVEAGLRSGSIASPWPEEFNRRTVSSIATLHCAPTRADADTLVREGIAEDAVLVTGNTVVDALRAVQAQVAAKPDLANEARRIQDRAAGRRIITVTCHRRENWGSRMASIASALAKLAVRNDVLIVCPLHPNAAARAAFAGLNSLDNVLTIPSLDYPNFVSLLAASHIVLTDSGGVQEEASVIGIPVLVLRGETERIAGVEFGNAKLVDTNAEVIADTAITLLDDAALHIAMARACDRYGDGLAAPRIVELIAGWQ